MSHTYWLGGLRVCSELPLPGLIANSSVARSEDVVIRCSRVPESLPSVTAEFPEGQCNENELLLNIPDAARYLIRHGAEILVDPAPLASPGNVAAYLLGTAFGVLCHQRGIPPLHASAIEVDDGCVAFTGDSGAGKSTLAAALAARGHQVISDDVCVLHPDDHGHLLIWPGLIRLRLWEDAMQALACERPGVEREFRGYNKYLIPLDPPRNPGKSRRLCRVYQLDFVPRRLRQRDAVARCCCSRDLDAKYLPVKSSRAYGKEKQACLRSARRWHAMSRYSDSAGRWDSICCLKGSTCWRSICGTITRELAKRKGQQRSAS